MSRESRSFGGATLLGQAEGPSLDGSESPLTTRFGSPELVQALAEVKGQAQFLLYLADQLGEALDKLADENDPGHGAFLCKILGMYSSQLESKHQGLGDKIAETCQEIYVTVREYDPT